MDFLKANWQSPPHVRAYTTQQDIKFGGNFNLASHVNDDLNTVLENRAYVAKHFDFTKEPAWLNQTHSNICVDVDNTLLRDADAAITRQWQQPLVILTADCLPIILCHRHHPEIAAIHAGWRGLHDGIIENTLTKLQDDLSQYIAWIGPAICGKCYQVGSELQEKFLHKYPNSDISFTPFQHQFKFDLSLMAEHILNFHGMRKIFNAHLCTFENPLLYSYRRKAQTGRIATFIWLEDNHHGA